MAKVLRWWLMMERQNRWPAMAVKWWLKLGLGRA